MRQGRNVCCGLLILAFAGSREAVGQKFIFMPTPAPQPSTHLYLPRQLPPVPWLSPSHRIKSKSSSKALPSGRSPTAPGGPPPPKGNPPVTVPDDHDDKPEGHHGDVGENPCRDKEIECNGVPPPKVTVQPGELPPAKQKNTQAKTR